MLQIYNLLAWVVPAGVALVIFLLYKFYFSDPQSKRDIAELDTIRRKVTMTIKGKLVSTSPNDDGTFDARIKTDDGRDLTLTGLYELGPELETSTEPMRITVQFEYSQFDREMKDALDHS